MRQIPKHELAADPFPYFAEVREAAAAHRDELRDGTEKWVLSRYEDVREALADRRLSNDPALLGNGHRMRPPDDPDVGRVGYDLLSTDPPTHTRLRATVAHAFSPRSVERLRPRVQELADALVDGLAARGEADLVADLASPLGLTVICEMFGLPVEQTGRATTPSAEPETEEQLVERMYALRRYLRDAVEQARPDVDLDLPDDEQPGLLHALIAASARDERLSDQELLDMLDVVVHSGHLGARTLISHSLCALLRDPDQLELLRQRPDLVPAAVEELARYDGAEDLNRGRIAAEDVELAGVTIPQGSFVLLMVSAANRDPRAFPDPDRLDIARQPNRHIAFGRGIHFCLGAALSRVEAQVGIGTVVRRLPGIELACAPEELVFLPDLGGATRRLTRLPVRIR